LLEPHTRPAREPLGLQLEEYRSRGISTLHQLNSTLATMCHMIHDSVTKPSTRPSSPDAATTCTVFCSCRSRRCSAGTRGSIHILMSLGCKQVTSGHSPPRISPELRESWTGAARSSLWKDDSTYRSVVRSPPRHAKDQQPRGRPAHPALRRSWNAPDQLSLPRTGHPPTRQ
jgi:hypothetical protein